MTVINNQFQGAQFIRNKRFDVESKSKSSYCDADVVKRLKRGNKTGVHIG